MPADSFIGELEQMVLLAILRSGEEAYGAQLIRELKRTAGRSVTRGSIYVTLDRMEGKGWIRSTESEPRPERGGRPRRLLSVTPAGVDQLRRSREALFRLWDGLERVIGSP